MYFWRIAILGATIHHCQKNPRKLVSLYARKILKLKAAKVAAIWFTFKGFYKYNFSNALYKCDKIFSANVHILTGFVIFMFFSLFHLSRKFLINVAFLFAINFFIFCFCPIDFVRSLLEKKSVILCRCMLLHRVLKDCTLKIKSILL